MLTTLIPGLIVLCAAGIDFYCNFTDHNIERAKLTGASLGLIFSGSWCLIFSCARGLLMTKEPSTAGLSPQMRKLVTQLRLMHLLVAVTWVGAIYAIVTVFCVLGIWVHAWDSSVLLLPYSVSPVNWHLTAVEGVAMILIAVVCAFSSDCQETVDYYESCQGPYGPVYVLCEVLDWVGLIRNRRETDIPV